MRDKLYLAAFLLAAGVLLFLGRDLLRGSVLVAWALTFGGTITVAILLVAVYRFRLQLEASRLELARSEAEISFALKVQQALFPRQLPQGGGLEFSAVCLPAKGISGDYYDVLQLPDGRTVFAVADISGKGISAAILMANLQALLRAVIPIYSSPSDICARLNQHLHQVTDASKFATFFLAEWSPQQRHLRYVNAGHNLPLVLGSRGGQPLDKGGLPLGVLPTTEYETGELPMISGDLVVLYSDGVTDAGMRSGQDFGLARLRALVSEHQNKPLPEIQARVLEAVRKWSGKEPDDDITLLLARAVSI
jgi:sigma-B regulation protein RsbU (phosphoserine phosphatase)